MPEQSAYMLVGHHPALDLVNTRTVQRGTVVDLWRTPLDMLLWCERVGIISPQHASALAPSAEAPAALATLTGCQGLRRIWHDTLRAHDRLKSMSDKNLPSIPAPQELLVAVNAELGRRPGGLRVERAGDAVSVGWRVERASWDMLPGALAELIGRFLEVADPARVRACASPVCVHYFLDTSKNNTRRFCCEVPCANTEKMRRRRGRASSERPRPEGPDGGGGENPSERPQSS